MRIALCITLFAQVARAGVSPPSGVSAELLGNETRRRVGEEVKKFLEERCPQQCDVGEVAVKVSRRKSPVGSTPGFEELQPDVKDFVVERVDVNVMLDKRLTNDFRAGVRTILAKKLEAEGMQNVVHENLIHFPMPQDLPEKPPMMPQYPTPPQPKEAERKDPPAPLAAATVGERSAWDRFVDSLPLLLGLLLCAGVVWFTLRQYQRILEARTRRVTKDEAEAAKQEAAAAKVDPSVAIDKARRELDRAADGLRARFAANRTLAREVARDLLANGAPGDAALAVVLLGPSLLDGVRADPESRAGLQALDDYLAERAPDDGAEARKRVLHDLERRVLRAQVAHGEEPQEKAFGYLRDVSAPLFAKLLANEPPEAQAIVLRQAPTRLVQAFLATQGPAARERLVRPLIETDSTPREEVNVLAAAFGEKLSRHLLLDEHGNPVGDLIQSAPAPERRRLLASLRGDPQALKRALASFVDEATLPALDDDVLATAMARIDAATAALFAGGLDEEARTRLYDALPKVTAQAIAEEAAVLTASPARRALARRAALEAVRRTVEERGLDLAEINRRVLAGVEEVAS